MKANELRLGNWINHSSYPMKVGVNTLSIIANLNGDDSFTPIELNTEVLNDFGFILEDKVWFTFPRPLDSCLRLLDGYIQDYKDGNNGYLLTYDRIVLQCESIKYLHTLQNLYYILSGKEL